MSNENSTDDGDVVIIPKPIDRTIFSSPLKKVNFELSPAVTAKTQRKRVNIHRICITGGACAGRTTAIKKLREDLATAGVKVLVVPNTATCVMSGTAATEAQLTRLSNDPSYLKSLVRLQASLEDSFYTVAQLADPGTQLVMLVDRGMLDFSAYVQPRAWAATMHDLALTEKSVRNERYDAVLHLVTAADGAQQHFN